MSAQKEPKKRTIEADNDIGIQYCDPVRFAAALLQV